MKGSIENVKIDPTAEPQYSNGPSSSATEEKKFFDESRERYLLERNSQDMGWLGKFFGCGHAAGTNIAGITSILSLLLLVTTFFLTTENLETIRMSLTGLASSSLGYLFGSTQNADRQ